MHKLSVVLLSAVILMFGPPAGTAQTNKSAMTNADVVELVEAGLNESTIVLAIHNSAPDFDTSSETLDELRKLGVGTAILEAMQRPGSADGTPQINDEQSFEISPNDVFLVDGETRIQMKRGEKKERSAPGGFIIKLSYKSFIGFDGKRSRFRVSDKTPEIEASLPADVYAAEKLRLVKLRQRSKAREIEIGYATLTSSRDGFDKGDIVPTIFEVIKTYLGSDGARYTLYRVKVVTTLESGEYAFVPRYYRSDYYDFGID